MNIHPQIKRAAQRLRHFFHRLWQKIKYKLGVAKPGPTVKNRKAMENIKSEAVLTATAELKARVLSADGAVKEDLGVISTKLVTDVFVDFLVDQLQASTGQIADFSWHGAGISSAAESAAHTALVSEIAVSRVNGTQGEGMTANVYSAMGVQYYDGAYAVVEHGLFNASSGGMLMDRSVFAAINVDDGDGIEFTYELTITGS